MKVLINTPHLEKLGGVANHYKGLQGYWRESVVYNYIGNRNHIPGSLIFVFDILKFIYKCLSFKPDIVVLNPSLGKTAIKRDAVYLAVGKYLNIKVIVFFHGWDKRQENLISKDSRSFIRRFNKADCFLVLASSFKTKMIKWGIDKPIFLTTTKVDNYLIKDFNLKSKKYEQTLLFLARVEANKGIFIALEVFEKAKKKFPAAKFIVAGDGQALTEIKDLVKKRSIPDVNFKGFIKDEELVSVFKASDLYLLPTVHGEGMPTSVLEAMAFGLPVITRPVGGLVDFFENGKMGYLIKSLEASDYSKVALNLLDDNDKLRTIGEYNHNYAKRNFMASQVAESLEEIFKKVIE